LSNLFSCDFICSLFGVQVLEKYKGMLVQEFQSRPLFSSDSVRDSDSEEDTDDVSSRRVKTVPAVPFEKKYSRPQEDLRDKQ